MQKLPLQTDPTGWQNYKSNKGIYDDEFHVWVPSNRFCYLLWNINSLCKKHIYIEREQKWKTCIKTHTNSPSAKTPVTRMQRSGWDKIILLRKKDVPRTRHDILYVVVAYPPPPPPPRLCHPFKWYFNRGDEREEKANGMHNTITRRGNQREQFHWRQTFYCMPSVVGVKSNECWQRQRRSPRT